MEIKSIQIVGQPDDGQVDADLEGYEYIHVRVLVNGEDDGRLSGYFLPPVAAHLRRRLGTGGAYEEAVDMVRKAVALHKLDCECEACYWLGEDEKTEAADSL